MADNNAPQPLVDNQPIVTEKGTPTQYFIRWAQARQEAIAGGVTVDQVRDLIDAWAADRDVNAGLGLDGGGNLSSDITINLGDTPVTPGIYGDATHVAQVTVDQQGRITDIVEVPVSGGGGGGSWDFVPPFAADFTTLVSGDATQVTLTDDADIGLCVNNGLIRGGDIGRFCFKPLPAAGIDWTVTAKVFYNTVDFAYLGGGLYCRDSTTDRHLAMQFVTAGYFILQGRMGTSTGYVANLNSTNNMADAAVFFRLRYVHATTTYYYEYSRDGKQFVSLGNISLASAFPGSRADQVGFGFLNTAGGTGIEQSLSCPYWVQSF